MDAVDPVDAMDPLDRLDRLSALNGVSPAASLCGDPRAYASFGGGAAGAAGAGIAAAGLAAVSIPQALRSAAVSQEDKIRVAAKEFESMLVRQMIKSMRDTVPEGGLLSKNSGEEMFQDFMDQELALNLSGKMGLGLSESLLRQLGGNSEKKGGQTQDAPQKRALKSGAPKPIS